MISLAALAIFSGLSLNLLLQFALGTASVAGDSVIRRKRELPLFQFGVLFVSVLLLWVVFSCLLPSGWRGFLVYFLCFPLSALACLALELFGERVLFRFIPGIHPKSDTINKTFSAFTAYDGLVLVSLIITLTLSGSFADAFVLSLFFSLGNLMAMLILNEIYRKSTMEMIPRFLRGTPLILVSMGLLSIIFASAAGILFKVLETF
ncbi:MAG: hypothetical protein FWF26_00315 [Treponema sp.]|nr:hypothetical protein [Treponema sp.]